MMLTSRAGLPFPQGGDPVDIPGDLQALAERVAALLGSARLTTLQRDALDGDDLYDGRVILNVETDELEVYDDDAEAWESVSAVTLAQLADVDTSGASSGQALVFDGTIWTPGSAAESLDDLGDVDAASPADGDVLAYDQGAGEWVASGAYVTSPDESVSGIVTVAESNWPPSPEETGVLYIKVED